MHSLPGTTEARDFPRLYEGLLWKLLRRGAVETNERTGRAIRALPPLSFSLDLGASNVVPVAGNRKLFPATAAAETAWYVQGAQDATLMMRHAKVVWEKFLEPVNTGTERGHVPGVKAAYGYRWRRHFGRDQLDLAVRALRHNPTDRRVWISAWDPSEDGLGAAGQLNVPCPVGFTFSIQDGRLNSAYLLRSSDVFVGLPYDVMGHAMLMAAVAESIDPSYALGTMHFTLAHPHVYDVHWAMAEESLAAKKFKSTVPLQNTWTLGAIEADPEGYIGAYKDAAAMTDWPEYSCKPEVVQ